MSTAPSSRRNPSLKPSSHERKMQKDLERARDEAIENTPEQRLIAKHQVEPKVTPSQLTLRECIIDNLSLAEMSLIETQCGTLDYLHAVHKVARFSLWSSYVKELKAMKVRQVQLYCKEATATRSTKMRAAYQHVACMYAIFHLVSDPSVRAEREAREISAATIAGGGANNARRL